MIFDRAKVHIPRPYKPQPLEILPASWQAFDRNIFTHNLHVEIGSGKGHWILNAAKQHPDQNYIAIERTQLKSSSLLNQANTLQLKNLCAVRADAILFLHTVIKDNSVSDFYIWFPNPTPKLRQSNKRFFTSSQFHVLHAKLQNGGKIHLASNILDYVDEAKNFLDQIWHYQTSEILIDQFKDNPRTAFEKKYQSRGENIYDLNALKTT